MCRFVFCSYFLLETTTFLLYFEPNIDPCPQSDFWHWSLQYEAFIQTQDREQGRAQKLQTLVMVLCFTKY